MAAPFDMGWIPATEEAGKCTDGSKPLIAGPRRASTIFLEMSKELQHMLGGEIAHGEPIHRLAQFLADEWQEKAEGVTIALAGVSGQIAFGDDVLAQEAPEPWAKGYEITHPGVLPHNAQSAAMPAAVSGVIDR
jgi:hypothetical protein